MELRDIRAMGEALASARELCQQAQFDKGLDLYRSTLASLAQGVRHLTKMAERQPWLQMQIELENELNLIVDYVELTQAFRVPPGAGARNTPSGGPQWEVYSPDAPRRPVRSLCLC